MFDTRTISASFGQAAAHYDAHADLQREVRRHAVALAQRYWPRGARILDLGCGTGALADEVKTWRITGLDRASGMCEVAAKRNLPVVNADAVSLPVQDRYFDGVFSSLMLQWVSDTPAVWREVARVTKPGGYAMLATFAEGTLHELSQAFCAVDDAPHVSAFAPAHRLLEEAQAAGLSLSLARQVPVVQYYPDTIALMRKLQVIGATHAHPNRRRGLMTSRQFARLEQAYQRFATPRGLPATWQVLYLMLRTS